MKIPKKSIRPISCRMCVMLSQPCAVPSETFQRSLKTAISHYGCSMKLNFPTLSLATLYAAFACAVLILNWFNINKTKYDHGEGKSVVIVNKFGNDVIGSYGLIIVLTGAEGCHIPPWNFPRTPWGMESTLYCILFHSVSPSDITLENPVKSYAVRVHVFGG